MLRQFIEFSVRHRVVVLVLSGVAVAYGGYTVWNSRLDVFPEFAPPQVIVQAEAPGLSPEEVEALATRPIENAIAGVGALAFLHSESIQGLSVVKAIFEEETDIYWARQRVTETVAQVARSLPASVRAPVVTPLTSTASMMLVIGFTSPERTQMELRTFVDWIVKPHLLGVPGVAKVAVYGGEVRQLQIQVDPDRLAAYGMSVNDVISAARNATGVRGGGFAETETQRVVIQSVDQTVTPEDLGEVVIASTPVGIVRFKDIGKVVNGSAPKYGAGLVNGVQGVVVDINVQYGVNTLKTTYAVEKALQEIETACEAEGIQLHPGLFRSATLIETSLRNVSVSLLQGCVLVAAALFLFLYDHRTAMISLFAIPLSLLGALIGLQFFDISLNTMTLGGLAIAIGVVVDDAIIDVENIFRRLRENRMLASPRSPFRVVVDASLEVRHAIIYATFMIILVCVPVLAMSGLQGRLFRPLALAFILAVLASLIVALTFAPALASWLLADVDRARREPRYVTALKRRYSQVLGGVARYPRALLILTGLACGAALAILPFTGGTFLPEMREAHFVVQSVTVPGTSLAESERVGREIALALLKDPRVQSVGQWTGRAELGDDTWGTHKSEYNIRLKSMSAKEVEAARTDIRDLLDKFPGQTYVIMPYLTDVIHDVISGENAEVTIKIFGDDLDLVDHKAEEIAQVLRSIPEAEDVKVVSPAWVPRIVIDLLHDRLQQFGLQPVTVLDAIQTVYEGVKVAQIYERSKVFDVTVLLDPARVGEPEEIGDLTLRSATGAYVPLREVADIYQTTGRYSIIHDGGRRNQTVTCNVAGPDVVSFVDRARRALAGAVKMPEGIFYVFRGTAEAQREAQRQIVFNSLVVGLGVVIALSLVFRSWQNLVLVLVNLPFALAGGVIAVYLSGGWMSLGALVGFVTLLGISTRNSIMLVSHFEHLVVHENAVWDLQTAVRGASERLLPILMTALTTALGLLPIAWGGAEAGREIEAPMAIVILGGLATATFLNLCVLPTLALHFGRFERVEE